MLPFYFPPAAEDLIREMKRKIEVKGGAGVCGKHREIKQKERNALGFTTRSRVDPGRELVLPLISDRDRDRPL